MARISPNEAKTHALAAKGSSKNPVVVPGLIIITRAAAQGVRAPRIRYAVVLGRLDDAFMLVPYVSRVLLHT